MDSRSAKWIASDAIRELTSEAVQQRLKVKDTGMPLPTVVEAGQKGETKCQKS